MLGIRGHRHRMNMLYCAASLFLSLRWYQRDMNAVSWTAFGIRIYSRGLFSCTIVQQHLIIARDYFCDLIYCEYTIALAQMKEQ